MFLINKFHSLDLCLACKLIDVILHTVKVVDKMFRTYRISVILCLDLVLRFGVLFWVFFELKSIYSDLIFWHLWSCCIIVVDFFKMVISKVINRKQEWKCTFLAQGEK